MTLKKTNLHIIGRPNFASVGGSVFRKKRIIKQSLSMKGFIKFQIITIMQSTKQELSPYNQIDFSKQVFVNTTKYSNIFMFTIVKRQIFIGNSHKFFPEFIVLTPPPSLLECQKFAGYNCTPNCSQKSRSQPQTPTATILKSRKSKRGTLFFF